MTLREHGVLLEVADEASFGQGCEASRVGGWVATVIVVVVVVLVTNKSPQCAIALSCTATDIFSVRKPSAALARGLCSRSLTNPRSLALAVLNEDN